MKNIVSDLYLKSTSEKFAFHFFPAHTSVRVGCVPIQATCVSPAPARRTNPLNQSVGTLQKQLTMHKVFASLHNVRQFSQKSGQTASKDTTIDLFQSVKVVYKEQPGRQMSQTKNH